MQFSFIDYSKLIIFLVVSIIVLFSTLLPFVPSEKWYIRMMDYPRLQTFIIALAALVLYMIFYYHESRTSYIIVTLLITAITIQAYKAFPYTPLSGKQVQWAGTDGRGSNTISLFICNVQQENKAYEKVIARINEYDADIVITTESNKLWAEKLAPIKKDYPYHVAIPQENRYGMHLYSKFPLKETDVRYLVAPDIPSITTRLQLRTQEWIHLFVLHPRPPFPTEDKDTKDRDAEIVIVGKEARKLKGGVIVAGDFNDVAWSETTKLFQEVSGLLDPRRGRGFYNTFNAHWPIFRWPLDHIFHSNHFKLLVLKKAEKVSSDHFPMYIKLAYLPAERADQPSVSKDQETDEEANEAIQEGKEND